MTPDSPHLLRKRVKLLTWLFIVGLVISGATAIPLESEVNWLAHVTGTKRMSEASPGVEIPALAKWSLKVRDALHETSQRHSFLFYAPTGWPSGIS